MLRRFTGNTAGTTGGALQLESSATVTVTRTVFAGNVAGVHGAVAYILDAGTSLLIQDSLVANHTNASEGALIYADATADELAIALDIVSFRSNALPALASASTALLQNCDGLTASDAIDASVGACVDTERFCMPEACTDVAVGTECYCWLNGEEPTSDPLPTGCMESAQLEIAVPSSLEITLNAMKPADVSQEVCVGR